MENILAPGPVNLVSVCPQWNAQFEAFDVFFDNCSNLLVLHQDGAFVIYDQSPKPTVLNLSLDK
jgi:hypothetical protein